MAAASKWVVQVHVVVAVKVHVNVNVNAEQTRPFNGFELLV